MYLLHLSRSGDFERVCHFLRSVHLLVETHEDGTISAAAPGAPTPLHERREIDGYVTTWNALNPGSPVLLVEPEA